jgi:hypothetical protein
VLLTASKTWPAIYLDDVLEGFKVDEDQSAKKERAQDRDTGDDFKL